jgi:hypothetical protein
MLLPVQVKRRLCSWLSIRGFSGLDCGALGVRISMHCTIFHFSCVYGVIKPTNVVLRVYPFVHFYFRLVNICQQLY